MRLRHPAALIETALIVLGMVLYFFVMPHNIGGIDGWDRYRAVAALLEKGAFSPTAYSMIGPLGAVPLYWLGKVWLGPEWWLARYNCIVFGLGLLGFYLVLTQFLRPALVRRFLLVLVGASMFPNHLRSFQGDVFTAIALGLGFALLGMRKGGWGWPLAVLGVVNTPATAVGYALALARRALKNRRWRHVVALVAVVALVLGENWIRRGHPLVTRYEGNCGIRTFMPYSGLPGFSYPAGFGILAILFSFGKGLVFFAPGLLLSGRVKAGQIHGKVMDWFCSLLWVVAGMVLVYGHWWAWYGGFSWGPRFFLLASIPASLALAVSLQAPLRIMPRLAVLAVLALSVWVGINGAVYNLDQLGICVENDYALESAMWYVPEFSVLWRPFVVSRTLHSEDNWLIGYGILVFLYLGGPLIRSTVGEARQLLVAWLQPKLKLTHWRF